MVARRPSKLFRHPLRALATLAVIFSTSIALADRVVLQDGNVVDGSVLRMTDRHVALKSRHGIITFSLRTVSEVRYQGRNWTPEQIRARHRGKPEKNEPTHFEGFRSENREPSRSGGLMAPPRLERTALKSRLERTLREIEANPLGPWETYEKERASRTDHSHRVRDMTAEEYRFVDGAPKSPVGVREVWVLDFLQSRSALVGETGPQAQWVPLYWSSRRSRWVRTPPNRSALSWETAQVRKSLERICGPAMHARAERVAGKLSAGSGEDQQRLRRDLQRITRDVAYRWGGDERLFRLYVTMTEIDTAPVQRKVELARKRRRALKELVALLP